MRRRSWARSRLLLPLVPIAGTVCVGVAHLASIDVPITYADQVRTQISVPTTLAAGRNAKLDVSLADDKGLYHFVSVSARLLVARAGVDGEAVDFTSAGGLICTAVTNAQGRAVCPANTRVQVSNFAALPATFTATFAGDGHLQGSSDTGALEVVGAGP